MFDAARAVLLVIYIIANYSPPPQCNSNDNKHSLSHRSCGSGIWEQLGWFWLRVFPEVAFKIHLELQLSEAGPSNSKSTHHHFRIAPFVQSDSLSPVHIQGGKNLALPLEGKSIKEFCGHNLKSITVLHEI